MKSWACVSRMRFPASEIRLMCWPQMLWRALGRELISSYQRFTPLHSGGMGIWTAVAKSTEHKVVMSATENRLPAMKRLFRSCSSIFL